MNHGARERMMMAGLGGFAGLSLYLLFKMVDANSLPDRAELALVTFAGVFFAGALSMSGPLRMLRALGLAAALAALVAALVSLASLRVALVQDMQPMAVFAAAVLASLPLPFLLAGSLRDYPGLFNAAWGIFVRLSLALVFVGLIWGVILLSNALFGLIGLRLIEDVLAIEMTPWLITGTSLGLALAVVNALNEYASPSLILRLLRVLIAPILAVVAVFCLALPLRGFGGLFGGLSSTAVLLAMVAAMVTLVSAAVDQSDGEAVATGWNARATRALAALVLVPGGLAAVALWLRVGQYGWTPGRLFAAWMEILALGYGASYLWAARGPDWRATVRRANIGMALAMIGSAVLWLSVLNPEAISTRSQMARFEASGGREIDLYALSRWGLAGAAARGILEERAKQPGQEALALLLKGEAPAMDRVELAADLRIAMPLQPASAGAMRDAILAAADASLLNYWLQSCKTVLANAAPGCVMVIADFWPNTPGDEAMVVTSDVGGYLNYSGLVLDAGGLQQKSVISLSGQMPDQADRPATILALQTAAPKLQAVPMQMISVEQTGVFIAP